MKEEFTMTQFNAGQKIGDIVTRFPKAADIFKEYRIDFCCGGERILRDVLQREGHNETEILGRINDLYAELKNMRDTEQDWSQEESGPLSDYVVNTHHAYLNAELPRISELITMILRVHGESHPELKAVHRLFHHLKLELEQHLIKEEAIEFPLMKEQETKPSANIQKEIRRIIQELKAEHDGAGDILKELRTITNDFAVPADACNSYRITYQKLEELESDIFQHVHLENNILFPRYLG